MPPVALLESAPATDAMDRGWEADALDDIARLDALHDMNQRSAEDFDFDTRADPEEVAEVERGRTVDALEHAVLPDEPYDALDAEDLGTAWLFRATETSGPSGPAPNELLDGGHVIEAPVESERDTRESSYGSDQEGAPLSPYAGTHDEDVAAELPVGTVDGEGNTELHSPANPPDALDAPPTGELAVSEEELARRGRPL
jgi:hypothetical protein